MLRLASAARRLFSAEGVRYAALLAALTVVAGGAGYAALEKGNSTLDGLYWAITTMTTVGYGDLSPETTGGKALAAVVMLVGIGFVAILTGSIAERFLKPVIVEEEVQVEATSDVLLDKLSEVEARLSTMEAALERLAK